MLNHISVRFPALVAVLFTWGAATVLHSGAAYAHNGIVHNCPPAPQPNSQQLSRHVYLPILTQNSTLTSGAGVVAGRAATPNTDDECDPNSSHQNNDYVNAEKARQRNEPIFVAPARKQILAVAAAKNVEGEWSAPKTWPFVFASAASLPDGRIITWGGNNPTSFDGGFSTYAGVWNPATDQITTLNNTDHSMFCAMPVMMEDGRVFVNGGDGTRERTSIFDYRTNAWKRAEDMHVGRWYPNTVALPNGQIFTSVGTPGSQYPELWTPGQGWNYLLGASQQSSILNFPDRSEPSSQLPHLTLAPNGQIFHSGHTPQMNWIDTSGNGTITPVAISNTWDSGNAPTILYDTGKLLKAGGGGITNRTIVIDLNGPIPTKTEIAPMAYERVFHNFVQLPNGEVMVIGGNNTAQTFSDVGSALEGEIWNPDTQQWRTVAAMTVPRNYHSVALLMTDGRVWSGGGGLCACAADHPDHQIYTPPYLFNASGTLATRPVINTAPAVATYGNVMSVQATAGIQKFNLIKMSGVTHSNNTDQRIVKVTFTGTTGQYQLTLPTNPNVLTPGYWMLFAINAQGVPSVAKIIQISNNSTGLTGINPGQQTSGFQATVALTITASNRAGQSLSYSASGLPTGLSINATTGFISGTIVTDNQVFNTVVTVTDGVSTIPLAFDWTTQERNWALGRPATQSSTEFGSLASFAVDGNTDGNAEFHSVTYTGENANAWWQVDLGITHWVDRVVLWNRTDCCSERLSNFYVFVSNTDLTGRTLANILADASVWRSYNANQAPASLAVPAGALGRYVRVQLAGTDTLSLAEVQVFGKANVALSKTVSQSSTASGGVATRAVDGNTNGTYSANSVTQTGSNANAWWQVDLSATHVMSRIVLWNRTDCCANRLTNFYVFVSSTDLTGRTFANIQADASVWRYNNTGQAPTTLSIPANVSGRYVRVQLAGTNILSLAEVQVYGLLNPAFNLATISSAPKLVNTSVAYTASSTSNATPRYKWLFGDGTAETAYSTSPSTAHTFAQPGLYVVRLTATDNTGFERSSTFVQAVYLAQTANRPNSSTNIAFETRSGNNNRVWVVNQDDDTVSVFDAVTNAKLSEIAVGSKPRSIAIAPNGNVWVSNKGAATLSIISPATLAVVQTVNLPFASQPFGVAFSPAGGSAFVALEASGKLIKLDAATGAQTGSADVGANVRGLAVSADGTTVLVSRFITPKLPGEETAAVTTSGIGGEIIRVNASTMTIVKTIVLQHSDKNDTDVQGRGIPNYLGAAAISPDGGSAWVPSKQDNVMRGGLRDGQALNFQNSVRAELSRINLSQNNGTEDYAGRIDHDNSSVGSAALFDKTGSYLFTALETSREVAVSDPYGKKELFRFGVGRAPQGLALSADGLRLYVSNFMDRSVGVYDLSNLINSGTTNVTLLTTLNTVATENLSAQVLLGKQLFYDAKDPRLSRDSYLSCATCHNDGGQDGRVWDMTGFGEGLRNTIALNGRAGLGHGFLHWSGNFNEVQDFEKQIRDLAGGTGLMGDAAYNTGTRNTPLGDAKAGQSADLDALAAYVSSLNSFAPSPYRDANGALTANAVAGRTVFQNANCAQCHGGTAFSNSAAVSGAATLFNIGTLKPSSGQRLGGPLSGIDPPTLRDVWATGPYLHDGSATTLSAAVSAHANVSLSVSDLNNVVAYLQQIGGQETTAPPYVPPTATPTPTNAPTSTPIPPTATSAPTSTPVPPTVTSTPLPPTATSVPTSTPVPPTVTSTPLPPTATSVPTSTPVPSTATSTPTSTPLPPTATGAPTNTPLPPTALPSATPAPTATPGAAQVNLTVYVATTNWQALTGWTVTVIDMNTEAELINVTNAAGAAVFGLAAGNYRVCQTLQPNWQNTYPNSLCYYQSFSTGTPELYFLNAPTTGATATPTPPAASSTPTRTPVPLTPTATPVAPTATPGAAQVNLTVYVATTNWQPLTGWTVTVTDMNTNAELINVTGAAGTAVFGLAAGNYRVCQTLQPNWQNTYPNSLCYYQSLSPGAAELFFLNAPTTGATATPTNTPVATAVPPTPTPSAGSIVDNLNDLSQIVAFSDASAFALDGSNASFLHGDPSRLSRTVFTSQWATWRLDGVQTFTAQAYFWPSEATPHFTFAWSSDGSTFTPIAAVINNTGGDWTRVQYTLNLPVGANYVRVIFPASQRNWTPQIGAVTLIKP